MYNFLLAGGQKCCYAKLPVQDFQLDIPMTNFAN